jgi:hypothetical protein
MLELLEQQQKLTRHQWLIAGAATLGDMLDFFDFLLIGFVVAFIVEDWHLTYGESGAVLFASGVATPFGSSFYGWVADKLGRRIAADRRHSQRLNRHRRDGADAEWRLDLSGLVPAICGLRTGLYSVDITFMQEFTRTKPACWFVKKLTQFPRADLPSLQAHNQDAKNTLYLLPVALHRTLEFASKK